MKVFVVSRYCIIDKRYILFLLIFLLFSLCFYISCVTEKKVEADLISSLPNVLLLPDFPTATNGHASSHSFSLCPGVLALLFPFPFSLLMQIVFKYKEILFHSRV